MAKERRGNREPKKPKQIKPKITVDKPLLGSSTKSVLQQKTKSK